ncbi:hypothetical protein EIN_228370 [Entamoeba invadens IP1]|uniref:Uncharacterized protein n=1 Tax=Entamoeba invadens IP1 TaxID=370355 RepID=A0A0A1U2X1_ENTIV|nr:hypothetical protein EIN_228370 [Entamoeba invadens IP1]ELP88374.1 hypothetical protein EIN_228370 [Entamoeba invadens IP1]|eukprot:XP_004255145.1 hypothetical protein EIN_228370 [Entamoeba invadens IP1]
MSVLREASLLQSFSNQVSIHTYDTCPSLLKHPFKVLAYICVTQFTLGLLSPFLMCMFSVLVMLVFFFRHHLSRFYFLVPTIPNTDMSSKIMSVDPPKTKITVILHNDIDANDNTKYFICSLSAQCVFLVLSIIQWVCYTMCFVAGHYISFYVISAIYCVLGIVAGVLHSKFRKLEFGKPQSLELIEELKSELKGIELITTEVNLFVTNCYYTHEFFSYFLENVTIGEGKYFIVVDSVGEVLNLAESSRRFKTNKEMNDVILDAGETEGVPIFRQSTQSPAASLLFNNYKTSIISSRDQSSCCSEPQSAVKCVAHVIKRVIKQVDSIGMN